MVAFITEKPQIARGDLIRLRNPLTGEYLHLSGEGATRTTRWSWCGTRGRAKTLEQRTRARRQPWPWHAEPQHQQDTSRPQEMYP
ncbi:hypothetical protein [Ponticoccus litoralis]|uniref:Uncharacterized protein n=1 Tax=Ponticoccus litoralis TaxID=422297 RepID=A0AAW9SQL6_9RHOB